MSDVINYIIIFITMLFMGFLGAIVAIWSISRKCKTKKPKNYRKIRKQSNEPNVSTEAKEKADLSILNEKLQSNESFADLMCECDGKEISSYIKDRMKNQDCKFGQKQNNSHNKNATT